MLKNLKTKVNLKKWELILHISLYILGVTIISILFYNSVLASLFFFPFIIFYLEYINNIYIEKNKEILLGEFLDFLKILKSNFYANYSLENSIINSYCELQKSTDNNFKILNYINNIVKGINLKISINELLLKFKSNLDIEEIDEYIEAVIIVKKTGGDIIKVTNNMIDIITNNIENKKEIETILAGKKMEFRIMILVPFVIVFYLRITFNGFLDGLYGNFFGLIIMSAALFIILISYFIGVKILKVV